MNKDQTLERKLWRESDGVVQPDQTLLKQYEIYVTSAEKVSDRRAIANTFFLTLNLAASGFIAESELGDAAVLEATFPVGGLIVCVTWAALLRSYRTLNTAKFEVIGLMEKRLPSSPFWAAEWAALGEGKDWRKHVPLGPIEMLAPLAFALIHAVALGVALGS